MEFEWDPAKDAANRDKHGISFEEAKALWLDLNRIEQPTMREADHEPRWKTTGSIERRLVTVVFTQRWKQAVRIISARGANRPERRAYVTARTLDP